MDKMELRGTYTEYLPSYTVGIDAYQAVPHVTRYYGTKAVVIGGETAMSKAKDRLLAAIEGSPLTITDWICYGKQATHKRAHELAAMDQVKDADMIFAVGGGRAIDTSKEVATLVDKPCFTFPTLASNCAPVTRICVLYHEDGSADQYIIPQEPPIHSFLDTQIIVESPDEYFWAGVGDAFSKGAEVELSTRDVDVVHSPLMGRALAGQQSCIDPLLEYGAQAIADKHEHKPTDAFERVVMNIIVTAGLISNMTTNLGPSAARTISIPPRRMRSTTVTPSWAKRPSAICTARSYRWVCACCMPSTRTPRCWPSRWWRTAVWGCPPSWPMSSARLRTLIA